jgi:hypothetical protein
MTMTREQAEALANIIVPAVKEHAKKIVDGLDDEDKANMHPQALAALDTLSGITGTFCKVEPQIDHIIDSLGWLAKWAMGPAYALLLTFQTILKQVAAVLCQPAQGG